MKVIVTGAGGQVGCELQRTAPLDIELVALQRTELDITNPEQVSQLIEREKPDWLINAAAYTAVDKAEEEKELAYRINRDGPTNIAAACKSSGVRMLHISTDFVFDGMQNRPYQTDSTPNPLGVYGASKQAGDVAVLSTLGEDSTIVRTSWVYSAYGTNFVKTMLRLMSERTKLGIVDDQLGTPTWANGLAAAIWKMIQMNVSGLHHWSDAGVASWYDFAVAIQEEAYNFGLLSQMITLEPIPSSAYPTPAQRPHYTVLDKRQTQQQLGCQPDHWRQALRKMLQTLKDSQ